MYEFNPMTSMELLRNLERESARRPAGDMSEADGERVASAAPSSRFGKLVRRMIQRMSPAASRRRAA